MTEPAYYIGSLVLHEVRDIESDQPVFDVIDGQQRLTTLFIALTHPDLRSDLLELAAPFRIADRLLTFEERKRSNLDLATLARPEVTPVAIESLQDDGSRPARRPLLTCSAMKRAWRRCSLSKACACR